MDFILMIQKYGDDDLTVGSIKPYQLFLIFNELVEGMDARKMNHAKDLAWMIDASHNVKDPLEDLLQSVEAIMISYAQALLVDRKKLTEVQNNNDVVSCTGNFAKCFSHGCKTFGCRSKIKNRRSDRSISVYRKEKVRENLIKQRGSKTVATGL